MNYDSKILIVGGSGTFGKVVALPKGSACLLGGIWRDLVTRISSVSTDGRVLHHPRLAMIATNKIVRTEYSNPVYTKLAQEAIELWTDTRWKGIFHQTGWVFGTDGVDELGRLKNFDVSVQNTLDYGNATRLKALSSWDETVNQVPILGSVPGHAKGKENFKAIYNGNAGWVRSTEAMMLMKRECESMGVRFANGPSGTAIALLRAPNGRVYGVKTADNTVWKADKTVLAAGSYCETLLDFEGQLQATAYVVSHIRMTEDEYQRYKDLPVLNISRRGYSFPPNEDRVFKICNTDISYINTVKPKGTSSKWGPFSVPRDFAYHPTDSQPDAGHEVTQRFAKFLLPELAGDERLVSSHMCWDAESFDYNWFITYHPSAPDSLFLATGGSGHSFKNIVNVGKYILHGLEGRLDPEYQRIWSWRPHRIGVDKEMEERASRPKLELKDATGWKHNSVRVVPGEVEVEEVGHTQEAAKARL